MVLMDITEYPAHTVLLVPKVRRAWQAVLDHVALKDTKDKMDTDADHRNWKQCAWKGDDSRDAGLVKVSFCLKEKCVILDLIFAQIIFLFTTNLKSAIC